MKFKNFVPAILAILRITEWTKSDEEKNTLTEDQAEKLKTMGFNDTFVAGFKTALENDFKDEEENGPKTQEQRDTRAAVLQGLLQDTTVKLAQANAELETMRSKANTDAATLQAKETEITNLNARIQTLTKAAEQDPGKGAGLQAGAAVAFNLNDEQQLAGMEGAMYAMDRPYNVRARAALLQRQGLTMMVPVASSMDYSRLREDLGAFYRIPWMDRLQSFLVQLPSIESIFPLESGYQDLATLVNIWLGEFSQSDNTESDFDNVVKGNYEFDNETLRMFDVMFAHRFKNLKQLEKLWIGSLNLEGSSSTTSANSAVSTVCARTPNSMSLAALWQQPTVSTSSCVRRSTAMWISTTVRRCSRSSLLYWVRSHRPISVRSSTRVPA